MKRLSHIGFSFFLLFFTQSSFAFSLSDYPDLRLQPGLGWGMGRIANESKSVRARTMNSIDANVMPGYRVSYFTPGIFFEGRVVGQNTEPSGVANTNMRGLGYYLGPAVAFQWNNLMLRGVFFALGRHMLWNETRAGYTISLRSPLGYMGELSYDIRGIPLIQKIAPEKWPIFLGASFRQTFYYSSSVGNTIQSIKGDPIAHWSAALGLSLLLQPSSKGETL